MTPDVVGRLVAGLERDLQRLPREEEDLAATYRAFLAREGAAAVDRALGRAHITASAFVLSPDLDRVLLCFHRKGDFWVQLGGHLEPQDESVQAAALREAREEGGIVDLRPVTGGPLDLDRHDLGPGFSRCDTHWDVGYGFVADVDAPPRASDESEAVDWWPVGAPPERVPEGFPARLTRAADVARARLQR